MKKQWMTAAILCAAGIFLSACQEKQPTAAEGYWEEAVRTGSIYQYVRENGDAMDIEALKAEAASGDSTLTQQFKATALLCVCEYEDNIAAAEDPDLKETEETLFRFDYPESASYADSYLAKVNTEGDAFWESLETAFYPLDCLTPVLAASEEMSSDTLSNLTQKMPDYYVHKKELEEVIETWMEMKASRTLAFTDALMDYGYYDDWIYNDWAEQYFYNPKDPYSIYTDTTEEALAYVNNLKINLLPKLRRQYGEENFQGQSELTGEGYYFTGLAVTIGEELHLAEPDESNQPETIDLEGKKVIAFYRNPYTEEFPASPAPLRVLGDFMMGLPREECPDTLEEADYYLVLTPSYEAGGIYRDDYGAATDTQAIYSSTSVDLYEAGTGAFLRHLANVIEMPPSYFLEGETETAAVYPELAAADMLSFIYHNANHPEEYLYMTDNANVETEYDRDEPVALKNWEITYHSCQIVKSFDQSIFRFTADEGYTFIRAEFTVTNNGSEDGTFLPNFPDESEDVAVYLVDLENGNYCESIDVINYSNCLNSERLDPGETEEGEVVFHVPDELVQDTEALYIRIMLGNQVALYPLN